MGCWGPGSFDNDEALDWLIPLKRASDKSAFVQATLEAITHADYYEQDACERAVAAAEFVACLLARRAANMDPSEEFEDVFNESNFVPDDELRKLAYRVVTLILEANQDSSELSQLETFSDAEALEEAHKAMADLAGRLSVS